MGISQKNNVHLCEQLSIIASLLLIDLAFSKVRIGDCIKGLIYIG